MSESILKGAAIAQWAACIDTFPDEEAWKEALSALYSNCSEEQKEYLSELSKELDKNPFERRGSQIAKNPLTDPLINPKAKEMTKSLDVPKKRSRKTSIISQIGATAWREYKARTGKKFYFNMESGKGSTEAPFANYNSGSVEEDEEEAEYYEEENQDEEVDHWRVFFDEESGKDFYFNPITEETSWDLPHGWAQHVDDDTGKTYFEHIDSGEVHWEIPADQVWEEHVDEATGRVYYHNKITDESLWKPDEDNE